MMIIIISIINMISFRISDYMIMITINVRSMGAPLAPDLQTAAVCVFALRAYVLTGLTQARPCSQGVNSPNIKPNSRINLTQGILA